MILMMGLYSIYTGFIYNDLFSRPLTFINSGWTVSNNPAGPPPVFHHVFPFGVDWVIQHSRKLIEKDLDILHQ